MNNFPTTWPSTLPTPPSHSLQQPTHTPTIRHRTHGMPRKPIPRMVSMKTMRATHTKHHQPRLNMLLLQRLGRPYFRRIRTPQPQHAQPTPRHRRAAVRTRQCRRRRQVFRASCCCTRAQRRGMWLRAAMMLMLVLVLRAPRRRGRNEPGTRAADVLSQREILLAV